MDPKKQPPAGGGPLPDSEGQLVRNPSGDDFFKRPPSDMRRPVPSQEAIASTLQAMQRLAAESVADSGVRDEAPAAGQSLGVSACETCGHPNRPGSQFCGMCGLPLTAKSASSLAEQPRLEIAGALGPPAQAEGQHHYHHHYHHHYFPGGHDLAQLGAGAPRTSADSSARDSTKLRAGSAQSMSRAEAAVRQVTKEWALACNTRQLDDLVSTYATDAMILRPNHPPVRGSAAIREFFFAALDAGLGEVELETLRVDVVGDMAYEAGRCKMLVPFVVGKRREERGKYLTVLARQAKGEWKIVADGWSSDLSLSANAEAEPSKPGTVPNSAQKLTSPRKAT